MTRTRMAAVVLTTAAGLASPLPAQARTRAQANSDAQFEAQATCPHRSKAVCMLAVGSVLRGLGGGRWRADERVYDRKLWEVWIVDYSVARCSYRQFTVEANGTFSQFTRWRAVCPR